MLFMYIYRNLQIYIEKNRVLMLKAKFSRVLTTSAVDHLMEKVQKKIYEKRSTKFYTQSLAKNISITNQ